MRRIALALTMLAAAARPSAAADDSLVCNAAIASVEQKSAMPKRVMGTIALVESGRSVGNRVVPWPWSINVAGVGHYYATKEEAIDAVRSFNAAGQRSIDVGCMQINLLAHPAAFASLDTAFEPAANADYAARFLRTLYQQSGKIATAMTAYHSQTPEFANDYARRLLAVWPGAAQLGLAAVPMASVDVPAAPVKLSKISLDTKGGTALAAIPVSAKAVSLHGGAWPH